MMMAVPSGPTMIITMIIVTVIPISMAMTTIPDTT
jgi:hypothetical protein